MDWGKGIYVCTHREKSRWEVIQPGRMGISPFNKLDLHTTKPTILTCVMVMQLGVSISRFCPKNPAGDTKFRLEITIEQMVQVQYCFPFPTWLNFGQPL